MGIHRTIRLLATAAMLLGVANLSACAHEIPPVVEREIARTDGVLFFLIQEEDCGDRLLAGARLDTLRAETMTGVVALVVNGTEEAAERMGRVMAVRYPVVNDPRLTEQLAETLLGMGHRQTPILVGVGPHGRTRFAIPVPANPVAQARAVALAGEHMRRARALGASEVAR